MASTASTPAVVGYKPVAWAGESVNITLSGIADGSSLSFSLDGSAVTLATQPQWWGNDTVSVLVPVGDADSATIKSLNLDIGNGETYTVNVTVMPEITAPSFVEDATWLEMFEGAESEDAPPRGWNATAWTFATLEDVVAFNGTYGKQRFSRASGVVASAQGAGTHTLKSPSVPLDGLSDYELRFASHYNITWGTNEQRATVSVSYDGSSTATNLVTLDQTDETNMIRAPLNPPANSSTATFTFTLSGGNEWSFWLIDDVELVHPLGNVTGDPLETIDIISDIQGTEQNLWMKNSLLPGMRTLNKASTLVINGDHVACDSEDNWASFTAAFVSNSPRKYYKDVISVAGNHEMMYDNYDSAGHITNFLKSTEMTTNYGSQGKGLWGEKVTAAGTPIIWLASEYFDYTEGESPPYVWLSDTQFLYLAERLAYWRAQKRPVLLFSHHPLAYSVSGTWGAFETSTFGTDDARFRYLLAANPHAVLFTSHTHYDIAAADQNVNHRPLVGNNNTVTTFNTGATLEIQGIGPYDWDTVWVGDQAPTGLQAEVYADRIRVKAYRFWDLSTTGTLIQTRDVGIPIGGVIAATSNDIKSSAVQVRGPWVLVLGAILASLWLS